ncbi:MAG: GntR family transcriptional regulator [Bacillota bacterium]|nr:GntR family transcriptional regulator [Bacillota bacterium]
MRITKDPPLYQKAYCAIKEEIAKGRLKPGQRLTDKGLADYLGISRTPVREAVKLLVKEGLLVSEPEKGLWVFAPSPDDLARIYALRAELEGLAAALTAWNDDRGLIIGQMEVIVAEAGKAAGQSQVDRLVELNSEFHDCMLAGSQNEYLRDLLGPVRLKAMAYRYVSYQNPVHVEVSIREHREIISLLRRGDPRQCQDAVRGHVYAAGHRLLKVLGVDEAMATEPAVRLCSLHDRGGRSPWSA